MKRTGLVFNDTLFDENATCHIAYGAGVTHGFEGIDGTTDLPRLRIVWIDFEDHAALWPVAATGGSIA